MGAGMRKRLITTLIATLTGLGITLAASASDALPKAYWGPDKALPILDKTITLTLAPDLSGLSPAERKAVDDLLQAGELIHELYLEQRHHQSLEALAQLKALNAEQGTADTENLLTLFRLFKGPVATTLDNEREAFLPVDKPVPGKNMYPWGIRKATLDSFIAKHPRQEASLLNTRTLVRNTSTENLQRDLATLDTYPVLDTLHPGLRDWLTELSHADNPIAYYAVPYSVAYADRMMKIYQLLWDAGFQMRSVDPDFADYLHNRARDMLTDHYESGDAAWVTGNFKALNAQIGSFETYDDELYGAKSFYSLSVLLKDQARSEKLEKAVAGIQAIEDGLPYDRHKKVRSDIPVGVYNVVADFGQARGTNTASILPNDADHARKYGRTILLRYNIMTNPELFKDTKAAWNAAVATPYQDDLSMEGDFHRTLWHEVGHYLGVATDVKGRSLAIALQQYSDLIEEMKADLVSLYAAPALENSGYYSPADVKALYASGVRRTLQRVKPRRSQPYQTMQLMQMNYFLQHGLIAFDKKTGKLSIDYARYHDVVGAMLKEVLAIQSAGDAKRAGAFVDKYAAWNESVQGVIAQHIRDAVQYRYALVKYAALGE